MSIKTLTDNQGREWKLKVTFPVLRTIRDECNLDLLAEQNVYKSVQSFLGADWCDQLDAIGEAIRPNHERFDAMEFAAGVDESVLEEGVFLFLESLANFFPSQSTIINKVVTRARAELTQNRTEATETLTGNLDEMMTVAFRQVGKRSGNSQGIPGSIPTTPASGN